MRVVKIKDSLCSFVSRSIGALIRRVIAAKPNAESREQAFYRIRQSIAGDFKDRVMSACIIREH